MELHKTIPRLCKEKGISPTQLSRMAKIKQPTLHAWLTGRKVKNIEELVKICDVFKISLHCLIFDKPDPYEKADKGTNIRGDI